MQFRHHGRLPQKCSPHPQTFSSLLQPSSVIMARPSPPCWLPTGVVGQAGGCQSSIIGQALGIGGPAYKCLHVSSPLIIAVNWETGVKGWGGGVLRLRSRLAHDHTAATPSTALGCREAISS